MLWPDHVEKSFVDSAHCRLTFARQHYLYTTTDGWGAYHRHLTPDQHVVGKRRTQQLERKHLTLRIRINRLVRKTLCLSRSVHMHDIVLGLFINRFDFGLAV